MAIFNTNIDARITAPVNQPFTPEGDVLVQALGLDDPAGFGRDIYRATVTNSVNQAFGRFTIEMAPRPVYRGKTWAEIIKPGSLCAIAFHRIGDSTDPAVTRTSVPLMLGLVDRPAIDGRFEDKRWSRTTRLTGRMLSSVLVDQRWWFHPILSSGERQRPALPDFRQFMTGEPASRRDVEEEATIRTTGLLAVDPNILIISDRTPARLIDAAFKFFVQGTGQQQFEKVAAEKDDGFVKLFFSDGVPLRDRLKFNAELAGASYVDPAARLVSQCLPTQLSNASCWDVLEMFNEPPFQETFCDVRGASIGNAWVELVSRKPPFAGEIGDPLGAASVIFRGRNRRPATYGESLFDEQRPGWDKYAETIYAKDGHNVISQGLHRSSEGRDRVSTMYYVTPAIAPFTGRQDQSSWGTFIPAIVDADSTSPSFIKKFGVRVFQRTLKTIAAADDRDETRMPDGDIARRCNAYAALAREWLYRMPEMWEGHYVLKGDPNIRAGKRLVDVDRKMEFYITAVSHTIDNTAHGQYTTVVNVERGWEIDNPI